MSHASQLLSQLLLLVVCAALAQGQGIIAGATCSSRSPSPAAYQACINSWVNTQQALQAPAGVACATCTSRPPQAQQSCVNAYIETNLQPPGVTDACGPAADKQACLNGLVDTRMAQLQVKQQQQQQQQLSVGSPTGRHLLILVGTDCASRGPHGYQQCINSFVLERQAAAQRAGVTAAGLCAARDQACINNYIQQVLVPAGGGSAGGCAGVAATQQQACLNGLVDQAMTEAAYKAAGQPLPPPQQQQPVPLPVAVPVPVHAPRRLLSLA